MPASCLVAEWFSWRLDSVCVSAKRGAPPYSHSEAFLFSHLLVCLNYTVHPGLQCSAVLPRPPSAWLGGYFLRVG